MSDAELPPELRPPRDLAQPREPAFNLPFVVLVCCAVLIAVHALRTLALSIETDNQMIALFAMIPARFTIALHLWPERLTAAYNTAIGGDQIMQAQIDFLIGDGQARWWTLVTYAFLHGSWAHVGLNCIWLVAFGSAVARRFSAARFLLLLLVSAIAGALVQYVWNVTSFEIVIGASAAVAGAMGAATRFVFRPADEPRRIFDRARLNEAFRQPALTLRQTLATRTALLFVLVWFGTNLLFGLVPSLSGVGDGPIAWQAHIGGFLAGLLLFPLFDPARPSEAPGVEAEDSAELPVGTSD